MHAAHKPPRPSGLFARQVGAYAIEFALVLPVMFVLSYAVMAFGLIVLHETEPFSLRPSRARVRHWCTSQRQRAA